MPYRTWGKVVVQTLWTKIKNWVWSESYMNRVFIGAREAEIHELTRTLFGDTQTPLIIQQMILHEAGPCKTLLQRVGGIGAQPCCNSCWTTGRSNLLTEVHDEPNEMKNQPYLLCALHPMTVHSKIQVSSTISGKWQLHYHTMAWPSWKYLFVRYELLRLTEEVLNTVLIEVEGILCQQMWQKQNPLPQSFSSWGSMNLHYPELSARSQSF